MSLPLPQYKDLMNEIIVFGSEQMTRGMEMMQKAYDKAKEEKIRTDIGSIVTKEHRIIRRKIQVEE